LFVQRQLSPKSRSLEAQAPWRQHDARVHPDPLVQHVPLSYDAAGPEHREAADDSILPDPRPLPEDRAPHNGARLDLRALEQDAPLYDGPFSHAAPICKGGSSADGRLVPDLASGSDRERGDRTRKAEDELTKMITQSEQHLWDERNQKNQLIKDVAALEEELVRLKAQRTHDEHFIQDLQEQLHQGGGGAPQGDGLGSESGTFNLEDELNNAAGDEGQTNVPLELSRLKAENELLRKTFGSTGDAALLRRELEDQRRQRDRLQQNFNEIFEKHIVTQEQIKALMADATGEG